MSRRKTTTEVCGTCENWTGERNPIFNGKSEPMLDIIDDYGNCENYSSRFCGQRRRDDNTCCHYSKWTEIL